MSISSMTAFARAQGQDDIFSWGWEVRSVNGKGLDLRLRIPSGWESLDPLVRRMGASKLGRGSVAMSLEIKQLEMGRSVEVDQDFLDYLSAICKDRGDTPSTAQLLSIKGVLVQREDSSSALGDPKEANAERQTAMLTSLEDALNALCVTRADEGARIGAILHDRLGEIEALVEEANALDALQPDALRERLRQQIRDLLSAEPDTTQAFPEDRLLQEAALLATKADIREELDRLVAHISAARDLLGAGGVIGRKLDFMCQEFNREANTLCSKSHDIDLTRIGLQLKTVIDQLREQTANIE